LARPGDFSGKEVSSARAREELGWEATTPFAEGVERYVEWRRDRVAGDERSWQAVDPVLLA
jgi:nucleoside-diphosphate-sugar epimerase